MCPCDCPGVSVSVCVSVWQLLSFCVYFSFSSSFPHLLNRWGFFFLNAKGRGRHQIETLDSAISFSCYEALLVEIYFYFYLYYFWIVWKTLANIVPHLDELNWLGFHHEALPSCRFTTHPSTSRRTTAIIFFIFIFFQSSFSIYLFNHLFLARFLPPYPINRFWKLRSIIWNWCEMNEIVEIMLFPFVGSNWSECPGNAVSGDFV